MFDAFQLQALLAVDLGPGTVACKIDLHQISLARDRAWRASVFGVESPVGESTDSHSDSE